jgi:hypothetical protein
MPKCKSCGEPLREAQANASIFALSFLPVNGRKHERPNSIEMAEGIGPLCPKCLDRRKDLAVSPEKSRKDDPMEKEDPSLDELLSRADDLKHQSAELFAQHELLHDELVRIFERIKRIHYTHPVIGPEPPDPPPPPPHR